MDEGKNLLIKKASSVTNQYPQIYAAWGSFEPVQVPARTARNTIIMRIKIKS